MRVNTNGRVDRNPKWRLNDIVFFETCGICDTKVEWQHENPDENNQNNFRAALYDKGWKKRFLMGWVCEKHR